MLAPYGIIPLTEEQKASVAERQAAYQQERAARTAAQQQQFMATQAAGLRAQQGRIGVPPELIPAAPAAPAPAAPAAPAPAPAVGLLPPAPAAAPAAAPAPATLGQAEVDRINAQIAQSLGGLAPPPAPTPVRGVYDQTTVDQAALAARALPTAGINFGLTGGVAPVAARSPERDQLAERSRLADIELRYALNALNDPRLSVGQLAAARQRLGAAQGLVQSTTQAQAGIAQQEQAGAAAERAAQIQAQARQQEAATAARGAAVTEAAKREARLEELLLEQSLKQTTPEAQLTSAQLELFRQLAQDPNADLNTLLAALSGRPQAQPNAEVVQGLMGPIGLRQGATIRGLTPEEQLQLQTSAGLWMPTRQ